MAGLLVFDVPAAAAHAIRIERAQRVAELAGVADTRMEYRFADIGATCHVECSREMALCLVEAFRSYAVEEGHPSLDIIACANAVAAIFQILERERDRAQN